MCLTTVMSVYVWPHIYAINSTRKHTHTHTNCRHMEMQYASQKAACCIKKEVSAILATLHDMKISTPSAPCVPSHGTWEVSHVRNDGLVTTQAAPQSDMLSGKSLRVPRSAQLATICTKEQQHKYTEEAYDKQMMAYKNAVSEKMVLPGSESDDSSRVSTQSTVAVMTRSVASFSSVSTNSSVETLTSVSDASQPASLASSYASASAASPVISGQNTNGQNYTNGQNGVTHANMHAPPGFVPYSNNNPQQVHASQQHVQACDGQQAHAHPNNGQTYEDPSGRIWGSARTANAHTHDWMVMNSGNQQPNTDYTGVGAEATGVNGRDGGQNSDTGNLVNPYQNTALDVQRDFNAALEEFVSMSMMQEREGDEQQRDVGDMSRLHKPGNDTVLNSRGDNQWREPNSSQVSEIARIMDEQSQLLDKLRYISVENSRKYDEECHGDGTERQPGDARALQSSNATNNDQGFVDGYGQHTVQSNGQSFVNGHGQNMAVNGHVPNLINGNGQHFVNGNGQNMMRGSNGQNMVLNGNGQNMAVNCNGQSVVNGDCQNTSKAHTPGKIHVTQNTHNVHVGPGTECLRDAPADVKSICEKYLHRKASATGNIHSSTERANPLTPAGDHVHHSINCFSPQTLESAGIPHVPTTPSNLLMRTHLDSHPSTPSNSHMRTHTHTNSQNRANENNNNTATQHEKSPGFASRPGGPRSPNSYVLGSMTPARNLLPNVEDVEESRHEGSGEKRDGHGQNLPSMDPASAHKTNKHSSNVQRHASLTKSPVLTSPNSATHNPTTANNDTHMYIHPSNLVVLSPGHNDPGGNAVNMTNYASHKASNMYESHKSATSLKNNYSTYQSHSATLNAGENNATVIAGAIVNMDTVWDDEVLPPPKCIITEGHGQNSQNVYAIRANNLFDQDTGNRNDKLPDLADSTSSIPPPTVHRQPGKYILGSDNYDGSDGNAGMNMYAAQREALPQNQTHNQNETQNQNQAQNQTEEKRPSLKERIAEQACECTYIHTYIHADTML
jgi:hypothetical protein